MIQLLRASPADRRLLTEGRLAGPVPWVLAIMMFLSVLTAGGGFALAGAATAFRSSLGDRLSIQLVEADPLQRERQAGAVLKVLRRSPAVGTVRRLSDGEIAALLEPWLGPGGLEEELPVPALIDVQLTEEGRAGLGALTAAVVRAAPSARVDDHARWLAPLAGLIGSLRWLALGLVLLIATATASAVVLAARGALNNHRATIEVLHLMGATDSQIARLFQRRIALDALFAGLIGFAGGAAMLFLIGRQLDAIGADLAGRAALPPLSWLALASLPLAGTLLATIAARITVASALRRML
jgi:cell division transport system permease protein